MELTRVPLSMTRASRPRRRVSIAQASPTGPAPMMITSCMPCQYCPTSACPERAQGVGGPALSERCESKGLHVGGQAVGDHQPAAQLPCGFIGGLSVERHESSRPAGSTLDLGAPLVAAYTGHLDEVVAAIDRAVEMMLSHGYNG